MAEARGLSAGTLQFLSRPGTPQNEFRWVLSVYTGEPAFSGMPAMLGKYEVREGVLSFRPQFPLEPGVWYTAVLQTGGDGGADAVVRLVTASYQPPARRAEPTVVKQVYPSGATVPENLLKFYIHFSGPMRGGSVYQYLALRDEAGKKVELPFLELDEELWNPEMTRLTVFIDPGRIKRGVKPLEDIGPALERGKRYTLSIDRAWQDAAGNALKEGFVKAFAVTEPDRTPPDPKGWEVSPPARGTRDPLAVTFTDPMDHALAERVMVLVDRDGKRVEGKVALEDGERRWAFTPAEAWLAGEYRLVVQTTIEDLAGNNIGKAFEVDVFERVDREIRTPTVDVPVRVR